MADEGSNNVAVCVHDTRTSFRRQYNKGLIVNQRGAARAIGTVKLLPTGATRSIWMVLAAWTADDTGEFFITSQAELGAICGYSRERINKTIRFFLNNGLITRLGMEGRRTRYRMNFDCDLEITSDVTQTSQLERDACDLEITSGVTQASQDCDPDVTPIEGRVNITVKEPLEESPEAPKQKNWNYPDWWGPLTELEGYVNRRYETTARKIAEACANAGVDPAEVVRGFADYYRVNRGMHGWNEPPKALRRTIGIQIDKTLKVNNRGGRDEQRYDVGKYARERARLAGE